MLLYSTIPQRCRVVLGTIQLKTVLHERVQLLYPEKQLSEVEVREILHSIIGSVITPLIDDTVSETTFQQASFDLIDYHLPQNRDVSERSYDLYSLLEAWVIRLVLSAVPQLTIDTSVQVNGFSVAKQDALILDVSINDAYSSRTPTRQTKHHETPEWDALEFGRF